MKKYILSLMSAMVLMGMVSCSDEELVKSNGAKPGDLVIFSVNKAETRTVYEDANPLQIDWVKGDQIRIFCEQAEGAKNAEYSITPTSDAAHTEKLTTEGSHSKYGLVDENESGLRWNGAIMNENPVHNFYAAYPSEVASCSSNGTFEFAMNTNQTCSVSMKVNADGKTGDGSTAYIAAPDMKNAYMVAAAKGLKAPETSKVDLVFAPVMTTLNVKVSANAVGDSTTDSLNVTGITISLPDVAHTSDNKFRYRIASSNNMEEAGVKGSYVATGGDIETSDVNFFTGIRFTKEYLSGNTEVFNSIPLASGQSVTFTVFLPPVAAANFESAKIRVNASGSASYAIEIGQPVAPSSKRNIIMPTIPLGGSARVNNWVTELDENIYINQLSIPGTTNSCGHTSYSNSATGQSRTLKAQWEAGVRAFEFRTAVADLFASYGRYTMVCYDGGVNLHTSFENAIDSIYNFVKGTKEFAIVLLSYNAENMSNVLGDVNRFWKGYWLNENNGTIVNRSHGMPYYIGQNTTNGKTRKDYFVEFKPDLTIKEAQGKIVLLNMDEFDGYPGALINGAESTDSEGGANVSSDGHDYISKGDWHTLTYPSGTMQNGLYLQNAFDREYGNEETHADKQKAIMDADKEAVNILNSPGNPWVINFVGGSGESGNSSTGNYRASAAANNKFYNDWLAGVLTIGGQKRAEGPTGIVMVSHQGVEYVDVTTTFLWWSSTSQVKVYGENLPQTIINNNFKFPLKRKAN